MYWRGAGAERVPLKARAALERGCEMGDGDACAALAQMQAETGRAGAEVAATAARACEAGSGAGCALLERMVRHGLDVPADVARAEQLQSKARELLTNSCDGGDAAACFRLASLVWDSRVTDADEDATANLEERGKEAETRACAHHDALACAAAAGRDVWEAYGSEGESQESLATRAALRRACDLDAGRACQLRAFQQDLDANERHSLRAKACALGQADACHDASSDSLNAREEVILQRDCDAGYGDACTDLADLLLKAEAPPEEVDSARTKARTAIVAACRTGAGDCFLAATLLEKGVDGPPDEKQALAMFDILCRANRACGALAERLVKSNDPKTRARGIELSEAECNREITSCAGLAELYERGLATKKNPKRAAEIRARMAKTFTEECDRGWGSSCAELSALYAAGLGVAKDPKKARQLNEKACEHLVPESCAAIGP